MKSPSKKCELLKDKIVNIWKGVFKEVLKKGDRMNIPRQDPYYTAGAFDTPHHLRAAYDKDLNTSLVAPGALAHCLQSRNACKTLRTWLKHVFKQG